MEIDKKILGMTTLIECSSTTYSYSSQGTGFFYAELEEEQDGLKKGPRWRKILNVWLITNRHVAFPKTTLKNGIVIETVPDSLIFNMRESKNEKIEWVPIQLTKEELINRTKLHVDSQVDVVAIKIDDLQTQLVVKNKDRSFIGGAYLTNEDLPSLEQPTIEATSDVVICSYPYAFYDKVNKFPIIKSGIVASSWGADFNGSPHFLVDTKLFPGSSGGLVLSKPTNIAMINGQLHYAKNKQYMLLGIYSGEYSHNTIDSKGQRHSESFGLGIVWYSSLIPKITENGISYSTP